jgi:hypothetical protein
MNKRLAILSWITGVVLVSVFTGISSFAADNVAIHGFVSQGYLKSDANNFLANSDKGSFQFN